MSDWKSPSHTTIGWDDERVERLKALWKDGFSASQIAKELKGVTRNAVIGKLHRLGLSGRATPSTPKRQTFAKPRTVAPKPERRIQDRAFGTVPAAAKVAASAPASMPPAPVARADEKPGAATVLTLGAHMCKWPIGDPLLPDFTHCGRRQDKAGPYCHEHAQVAYQPAQAKKKSSAAELARSLRRYI